MNIFKNNKRIAVNLLIVLFILFLLFVLENLFITSDVISESCENMNNLESKAVDILVETNKLLVSLSLLVIGGMGGIVIKNNNESNASLLSLQIILIIGMLLSSLSIYFGYSLYIELTHMLSYSIYDVDSDLILQLQSGQFLCFIASIVLGIVFLINHIIITNHETKE